MTQHDVVSIVGGGWSFRAVNQHKLTGIIIGVNEASVLLECLVNYGLTMDRLWMESRYPQLCQRANLVFVRKTALQNIKDWQERRFILPFDCDHTSIKFSEEFGTLNGTNSGMCALNLAYQFRPKKLYLFGFDMCRDHEGRAYWHEPYPWTDPAGATKPGKYGEWAKQFDYAAALFKGYGCEVLNVSPYSRIDAFKKVHPQELGVLK